MNFGDLLGIKCKTYHKKVFKLNSFSKIIGKFAKITLFIERGDEYQLVFAGNENLLPTFKVQDDTLYIRQTPHLNRQGVLENQVLKIIIPASCELQECELFNKLGDIDLHKLNIEKLHAMCQEGELKVYNSKIEKTELKTNCGDLIVHSCTINDGFLAVYEGELKVLCSNLNEIKLDVTEGNIIMTDNTLRGGSSSLYEGNFTLTNVILKSDYIVNNNEGNNTAWNINVKRADLESTNGTSSMKAKLNPAGFILRMVTLDGDNLVK